MRGTKKLRKKGRKGFRQGMRGKHKIVNMRHQNSVRQDLRQNFLRNMYPPRLCNGTRLAVKKLMPHVIEATILTGCGQGDVFIPCIPVIPTDMPFDFRRLQFPITLSFAMTINKSQGQTLKDCRTSTSGTLLFTWATICGVFKGWKQE